MKSFIGIDLGTTNSAISSYDGSDLRLYKSPEGNNEVTPSAILIDKRGRKYVGSRAYNNAPWRPDNAAILFKRLMGTSTPIHLKAVGQTFKPEECSAEILKVLFGYLPEEVRNSPDTGTVVTVPAAFNQMQRGATLAAAELAGIGKVALMQEPVAAVMSVARAKQADGMFLIFDMGGGTLDVAIAQSIGNRVSLLAHGGIEMCGGRDWDRMLFDHHVKPWLLDNFDLPDDFAVDDKFRQLSKIGTWATEKAKIELSYRDEAFVQLDEDQTRVKDLSGEDIYFEVPISRANLDDLIREKLNDAISSTRDTLEKAGLTPQDLTKVVFVGGPSNYKPLRDRVSFELGIESNTGVDPMTAVSQGAALFAESVDWSSERRGRKSSRGAVSAGGEMKISFNFIARTPDPKAKLAIRIEGQVVQGAEFQVESLESGWSSGKLPLSNGAHTDLPLSKPGDNQFRIWVFDASGGPLSLEQDKITIARTAATVEAIPASHSIGIEVMERLGGPKTLEYLVKAGDPLPSKGQKKFKTAESLRASSSGSINFKIWEGEIDDVPEDNRFVGVFKIAGNDFDDGAIPAGADLLCDYEVLDSGNIVLEVSVPDIGAAFHSGHNFYSRQEAEIDYTKSSQRIQEQGEQLAERIDHIGSKVDSEKLDQARNKAAAVLSIDPDEADPEVCKQADDDILAANRLLSEVRKEHLQEIRQIDLDGVVEFFEEHIKEHARASEVSSYNNLARTAQRSIDRNDPDFENYLDQLKSKNFEILWRQDWFVVGQFEWMLQHPHRFSDLRQFNEMVARGRSAIQSDDFDTLRQVVAMMSSLKIGSVGEGEILEMANILRG